METDTEEQKKITKRNKTNAQITRKNLEINTRNTEIKKCKK